LWRGFFEPPAALTAGWLVVAWLGHGCGRYANYANGNAGSGVYLRCG
jgi:hypothetical protein